MRILLIFLLTCLTEFSHLLFWVAAFFHAVTWQHAWVAIVRGGPEKGFAIVFACVASLVVPCVIASVFGAVLMMMRREQKAVAPAPSPATPDNKSDS